MIFFVVKYHLFKVRRALQIVFVWFVFASVCFYKFIRELKNCTTRILIFRIIFFVFKIFIYVSYNFVDSFYSNGWVSTILFAMIVKTFLTIHVSIFRKSSWECKKLDRFLLYPNFFSMSFTLGISYSKKNTSSVFILRLSLALSLSLFTLSSKFKIHYLPL